MTVRLIPADGIAGETAIREAAAGDYQQIMQLVGAALRAVLSLAAGAPVWPCVSAIFADRVVVERDGRFYAYPYTLGDDNQVTLGTPAEVVRSFAPVRDAMRESFDDAAIFLEADAKRAGRFEVRVIRAGASLNRKYYPDAVLREAVPLFEGARVFCKSDREHLAGELEGIRSSGLWKTERLIASPQGAEITLADGDRLEIVQFVGGG